MLITINGEEREFERTLSIGEMLAALELASERIAVELNEQVVRRKDWESVELEQADRVEIIHFVGGG